jgi:hypothetical protein
MLRQNLFRNRHALAFSHIVSFIRHYAF